MVAKKTKKTTIDPKLLRALVVDEDLLEQRRKTNEINKKSRKHKSYNEPKPYTQWDNMKKSDFIKKEYEGHFYAKHNSWKKNVWIGPYTTEQEVDKVINSYVSETKKPPIIRKIKNIHSIIIDLE